MSIGIIAPFIILRVAGMNIERLANISQKQTAINMDRILDLTDEVNEIKKALDEALFHIISSYSEEEKVYSNLSLKLKRKIFNDKAITISDEHLSDLKRRLTNEDYTKLIIWQKKIVEKEILMNETKELFEQEIASANKNLALEMEDAELQKGLAIANPGYLYTYRKDKQKLWQPHKQYARTSTSYLHRMTVKTSPFSTFTKIGMTSFDEEEGMDKGLDQYHFCSLSRALSYDLVQEMAKTNPFQTYFTYERNRSIQFTTNSVIHYMKSTYTIANGFSWRTDNLVSMEVTQENRDFLETFDKGSFDEIAKISPIPFSTLVDMQWIKPILPYSRQIEKPLHAIGEFLEKKNSRKHMRLVRIIKWIENSVAKMENSRGEQRLKYQKFIYQQTKRVFDIVSNTASDELVMNYLIYEDVRSEKEHPSLGKFVKQDLELLADTMRPFMFTTHLYDLLCDHFIQLYGREGICTDVKEFLYSFENRKDRMRLIKKALMKDMNQEKQRIHERVFPSLGESTALPNTILFFQLAAQNGLNDIKNGQYQLVVNQAINGLVGLVGRFESLFRKNNQDLPKKMADWLQMMYPNAELVTLPVVSEYNDLQKNRGITERSLRIGGESPTTEEKKDYVLEDLRLVHSGENKLTFTTIEGKPIAPVYLGTVPQHMHAGLVSTIMTIAMPWVNAFEIEGSPIIKKSVPSNQVEYHPQMTSGRIVLKRAKWVIPRYLFPIKDQKESSFNYYTRLKAFQRLHQLPNEGFLANDRAGFSMEAKKRKPMYINFDSYHSIEAAVKNVLDSGAMFLSFREALPNQNTHWFTDNEGKTYTTEYMSLLQWPEESTQARSEKKYEKLDLL